MPRTIGLYVRAWRLRPGVSHSLFTATHTTLPFHPAYPGVQDRLTTLHFVVQVYRYCPIGTYNRVKRSINTCTSSSVTAMPSWLAVWYHGIDLVSFIYRCGSTKYPLDTCRQLLPHTRNVDFLLQNYIVVISYLCTDLITAFEFACIPALLCCNRHDVACTRTNHF